MKAFFGTTLGKVIIGVLAAAVVAGGGYGIYQAVQSDPAPIPEVTEEVTTTEAIITTEADTTTEEEITEAPTEAPTEALTTTAAATTSMASAKPAPIKMKGINNHPGEIAMYSAEPEVIFEWNVNGYWEFKSGTSLDPEWTGGIGAAQWTVPEGYEFRCSLDWSNPDVAPYAVTGTLNSFGIGPGDRLYKID